MRHPSVAAIAGLALLFASEANALTTRDLDRGDSKPRNVLFIIADDLRPELGCYGSPAITPHIDQLAGRGIQFNRAYCQQALCNPSRSSLLTGLRPDRLRLWANGQHFRGQSPDVVTLPQFLQRHGYVTRDVGKIFHNWHTADKGDRRSWSAPEFLHYETHANDKPVFSGRLPRSGSQAPRCEAYDVPDNAYFDGRVADEAVRVLDEIQKFPFFLAVGFWKPHAPFNAPKRYWDRYDRAKLPPLDPARPRNVPEIALHDGRELRGLPPNQLQFSADDVAEIRHGYFANVTYMDEQLGKVLAALQRLGLADSTLIVFLGDHGYHLGEHGLWAKTSCFELDARVPLIIAKPGTKHAGSKSNAIVELVDLFPTIIEWCELEVPAHDGSSLLPILDNPRQPGKPAAFTQHPRPAYYDRTATGIADAMGYSVRTAEVRYTEWRDARTARVLARELYDHTRDPGELHNQIGAPPDPTAFDNAVRQLHGQFPPDQIPMTR